MEKSLALTDAQAHKLINLIKHTITRGTRILKDGDKGSVNIDSNPKKASGKPHKFIMYYFYAKDNIHLQFQDAVTNLTLVRINLDSRFHNNSDGKVRGHRIEIFSSDEYYAKNDTFTHYKAFALPYDGVKDTDDFLVALEELFDYTNVIKHDNVNFSIDTSLPLE